MKSYAPLLQAFVFIRVVRESMLFCRLPNSVRPSGDPERISLKIPYWSFASMYRSLASKQEARVQVFLVGVTYGFFSQ
jgi:hypothetical protein